MPPNFRMIRTTPITTSSQLRVQVQLNTFHWVGPKIVALQPILTLTFSWSILSRQICSGSTTVKHWAATILEQLWGLATQASPSASVHLPAVPSLCCPQPCCCVVVLSLTLIASLDAHSAFNINHYGLYTGFPFLLVAAGCSEAPGTSFPLSQPGRRREVH